MNDPLIFLSHAGRDKELADAFRTLLVLGLNLRQSDIFYTSSKSGGIPIGADFNSYMQDQLKGVSLVVSLVTIGFYESAYCMCELGYQSALSDVDLFPVIFPGIDSEDVDDLVVNHTEHTIKNRDCMNKLADLARKHVPDFSMTAWNEHVEKQHIRTLKNDATPGLTF